MNNQKIYLLGLICFIAMALSSCIEVGEKYTKLPPGKWRGVLFLDPKAPDIPAEKKKKYSLDVPKIEYDDVIKGELPFNFEVVYDDLETFHIVLINGDERMKLDDIKFGHKKSKVRDTIRIDFPVYDTYIEAEFQEDVLTGHWHVPYKSNGLYRIPFIAHYSDDYRFTDLKKVPVLDMSGKWETTFYDGEDSSYPAIGDFKQEGNKLTGTFLTETGDYRFLEGTVQENEFYLSCFDGAHAFYFEGKVKDEDHISGIFRSGKHYSSTFEAIRNPDVSLPNADHLTYLNEGYDEFNFSVVKDGKTITLDDPKYQGKAKIIQIFGTWCPNCRDETDFLVNYFKANPKENVEVIALAFERYKDMEKSQAVLDRYQAKYGMEYDVLLAGYYNKKEANKVLPSLNHVLSYPTLIFIDKDNKVERIHTGFSGPATGAPFEKFKKKFKETLAKITS